MSSFHALLVHFPIALLSIGFLFDASAMLRKDRNLALTGWWMHACGTVGVLLAAASGLIARESVEASGIAGAILETHQELAFASVALFSALMLWRVAHKKAIPGRMRWLFMVFYGIGVTLLWTGAWLGGTLVYEHGIGVFPLR